MGRKIIICSCCKKIKQQQAKNMCNTCYRRFRYNTIDKFNIKRVHQIRKAAIKMENNKNRIRYRKGKALAHKLNKFKKPCEICGKENVEKHHIDKNPYNNILENIKWLCKQHHIQEHGKMVWKG